MWLSYTTYNLYMNVPLDNTTGEFMYIGSICSSFVWVAVKPH
jgi:hypothetical protein